MHIGLDQTYPFSWQGVMTGMEDLVKRARDGDVGAFETLYRQHSGRVYALCLRLTADPSQAEEHTHETFIQAWRKLGSFRGESKFASWLYRVAVNIVVGAYRSRSRSATLRARMEPPRTLPAARVAETRMDLERAAAGLPPAARQVFVLHDIEGYKHAEIAAMTGVTVGTSKAQLHRARKLLRKALRR